MSVLVIDDDLATRKMLHFILEQQLGQAVREAPDADSAQTLLEQEEFDLVIVDVVMPHVDGFELCRRVRRTSNVPIIIVSARDSIPDRVRGLRAGADDYLPKPFDPSELAARVEAVLRRARRSPNAEGQGCVRVGELTLNLGEHTVRPRRGQPIQLTPTEFRLLLRLARSPGQACTRAQLIEGLWGHVDGAGDSTVSAYIAELRAKLEADAHHPRYIVTVRGKGYRLDC